MNKFAVGQRVRRIKPGVRPVPNYTVGAEFTVKALDGNGVEDENGDYHRPERIELVERPVAEPRRFKVGDVVARAPDFWSASHGEYKVGYQFTVRHVDSDGDVRSPNGITHVARNIKLVKAVDEPKPAAPVTLAKIELVPPVTKAVVKAGNYKTRRSGANLSWAESGGSYIDVTTGGLVGPRWQSCNADDLDELSKVFAELAAAIRAAQ